MVNEIAIVGTINAVQVFTTEGGADPILTKLKEAYDSFVPDLTTASGRKEIASYAYKFSTSKSAFASEHKKLVADEKAKLKKIDAVKKTIDEACDMYRDLTRKPLTDWEQAEEKRVAEIVRKIDAIKAARNIEIGTTSEAIKSLLDASNNSPIDEENFGELLEQAQREKETTLAFLTTQYETVRQAEIDKAELEKLRKEKEEREAAELAAKLEREKAEEAARLAKEQEERDERIKKEAAEEAIKKADEEKAKIQREKEEAEAREKKAIEDAEKARLAAIKAAKEAEAKRLADIAKAQAEERAKIELEQKAKVMREEAARKAAEEADRVRRENQENIAAINRAVRDGLMNIEGVDEALATEIVKSIAKGKVPFVAIEY